MELNINIQYATEYEEILTTKARIIILMGGRMAGRSGTACRYALDCLIGEDYERILFMRQIYGDIRHSTFADFTDLIEGDLTQIVNLPTSPQTAITTTYNENYIICKGFKKSDGGQEAKLKSIAGITKVFIDEANEITEEDFDKLDDSLRTTKGNLQIVMCLNPPHAGHWILERWFDLIPLGGDDIGYFMPVPKSDPSFLAIQTNYQVNSKNLNPDTVRKFEEYYPKHNPSYHKTTVRGLVKAVKEGQIYTNYTYADSFPEHLELQTRWGLDFGYTSDPNAIVKTQTRHHQKWVQQIMYETGASNERIADVLHAQGVGTDEVVCDSAQPKDIDALCDLGINAVPAPKGAGSVATGIKDLQSMQIFIVGESPDLVHEKTHYIIDAKTGKPKGPDHLLDALRYEDHSRRYADKAENAYQKAVKRRGNSGRRNKTTL